MNNNIGMVVAFVYVSEIATIKLRPGKSSDFYLFISLKRAEGRGLVCLSEIWGFALSRVFYAFPYRLLKTVSY